MVSRRNFFTITLLMFIVFFMCMFSNNLKDMLNDYMVNDYAENVEDHPSGRDVYHPGSSRGEAGTDESTVVFIGRPERKLRDVVWQWVTYSKRNMEEYASLADYEDKKTDAESGGTLPEMLVIDSVSVEWTEDADIRFLKECVDQGIHIVFTSLPDVSVIKESRQVRHFLGIREIVEEKKEAAGLHLYGGFLLGGEEIYLPEDKKDKDEEDIYIYPGDVDDSGQPVFPWYLLTSGTKIYMKGIPEDESVDTEDYPALIWRKSFGSAYVFAVNGSYMEGIEGMGLLSAMTAQMYPYEIYPVLNAQNMIVAGYPSLADENGKEMEHYYAQSMTQVFQEILEPNTRMVFDQYRYKPTCMLTPQFDYTDGAEPDKELFEYYLKVFKEHEAETGLSGQNVSDISVSGKVREDMEFVKEAVGGYEFSSFYAGDIPEKEIREALDEAALPSVRTIVTDYKETDNEIIKFISEDVTVQAAFDVGLDYTYKNDFLVRSLETALGYLNISFDMMRVAYPEDDSEVWEKLLEDFGVTVSRYSRLFGKFEATTASECDVRIRDFLALDYKSGREGNTLRLETAGAKKPVWFILRTNNESIKSAKGGSFKQLEEGAYLIRAKEDETVITLEPSDTRYYQ